MSDPTTHPCEIEPGEFDHDWKYVSDWGGDPEVINGTFDCSHWECRVCGETKEGDPPQYDYDDCDMDIWPCQPHAD